MTELGNINGYVPESQEELDFLLNYDPSAYPITTVTVDVVALQRRPDKDWRVLLIQRKNWPYKGHWALPGGFIDVHENAREAAARELSEETGCDLVPHWLTALPPASKPNRDPRGRVISLPFWYSTSTSEGLFFRVKAGDDAARAQWVKLKKALSKPLAFDHRDTLCAAVEQADEMHDLDRNFNTMRLVK